MKNNHLLQDINVEKLLKYYRRYKFVRFLLLNPIFRALAMVLGGLLIIILWPFALMYLAYRTIRFSRRIKKQRSQRYIKNKEIIDL